ncbi:MFS transporter [Methylobacterium nodulans]|uniref:Major facilitator superfamily MFS_1 n=1 Tax=Methylobacterium nodulans (strain LMG 21967 / CNCM I-2342 / ORS 2060) TaxID=460265 RepID=B8ILK2_METNO|nr:MFS transporter [Methylobacterium nodulans]ACL61977.1 major facilitator superfamily MFS_1 [Methylobacterium nodulans ORS 2060]
MIRAGLVLRLGLSQLVLWGISYYLVGVFGPEIGADLGISPSLTYGGFSVGLLAMGFASPAVGRAIDARGGRAVMSLGSLVVAAGLVGLASCRGLAGYGLSWLVLGLGMRMTLYEAAFAALARIGGPEARGPIAQVTLFGGLASSVLWPVGHALAEAYGWRMALLAYAGLAVATLPLHLAIPDRRHAAETSGERVCARPPLARTPAEARLAGRLYALTAALASVLNAAMSAHMIPILIGLGIGPAAAVWIGTVRGIGQTGSRLGEVLFGRHLSPLALGLAAALLLPAGFAAGFASGAATAAALAFALLYGAGNGLLTIVRGTVPLVLFAPQAYGTLVGRLLAPSFVVSALAPLAFAAVIERFGETAALALSLALSGVVVGASAWLWWRFGRGAPDLAELGG